jgi:hypothetical protein
MHLDEVWQVVEKSQAQNVSMYKVAMLSADGASAGSCLYWQQKLNAMYYKRSRMSLLSLEPVRISVCTDASVHSCRDTLISIFYSCQNDISCYGISQHLWPGKIVSAGDEVAVETEEMERLLARREQSRLATYKLAQALSQQLQLQVGLVLNDFAVPEKILPLMTPGNAQDRQITVDGNLTINGSDEIDVIQATYDVPVLCLLVDQASTDMALASFLNDSFFFIHMDFDVFHRLARDQKLASEHCGLAQAQLASQQLGRFIYM